MSIPASVFKAECLQLMDEVERTGQSVVITKHGKPVAQLAPVLANSRSLFGYMKHTVTVSGDIVRSLTAQWSANFGGEDALYGPARQHTARHLRLKK